MKLRKYINVGSLLGLIAIYVQISDWQIKGENWAQGLLLLAAFIWLPMLTAITRQQFVIHAEAASLVFTRFLLPSACLLALSFRFTQGSLGAILSALPWFCCLLVVSIWGMYGLWKIRPFTLPLLTIHAAWIMGAVGGAWLMADRIGMQPLGFSPSIVLLTALHFHYAGIIFPSLAGFIAHHTNARIATWVCILALTAIPSTAIGITISHLFHTYAFESLSAIAVVLSGWSCAFLYLKIAFFSSVSTPSLSRIFWGMCGVALIASMTLAALYALRAWVFLEILTIPNMRAWHGTLNAVVVAGGGVLGWWIAVKNTQSSI